MTTCRFCNRPLSNPRHAAAGVGPTCAKKRGLSYARRTPKLKASRSPKPTRPSLFEAVPLPFGSSDDN